MEKLFLTIAISLMMGISVFAQQGEGALRRSKEYEYYRKANKNYGWRDGGTFSLCLPGHNFTTNWNGGSQGHDDDLLPLGSGALLLMGFGVAYAMSKRKKED